MFSPSLALLRRVISPRVSGLTVRTIKVSASPSSVQRVALEYSGGQVPIPSVILKKVAPEWPGDPYGHDRERCFYTELRPCLGLNHPCLYYAGVDTESQYRLIFLEDVAAGHRFPPPNHTWTGEELRCLLRTYARLHVLGQSCLPPEPERYWLMSRHEDRWTAEGILGMVDDLVSREIWPPLPGLERLLERTLAEMELMAGCPATVLHNDVYPPNGGLPSDLDREAVLIDWEMVGWGLAELDLAYLFTQPFGSTRRVNRHEALDYYWQQRQVWQGCIPSAAERLARQRHADALLALSLVPVAHKVAADPYPIGSAPRAYWDAMFGVLYERLQKLCETSDVF